MTVKIQEERGVAEATPAPKLRGSAATRRSPRIVRTYPVPHGPTKIFNLSWTDLTCGVAIRNFSFFYLNKPIQGTVNYSSLRCRGAIRSDYRHYAKSEGIKG